MRIIVVDGNSARTRELAKPLADKVFIQTSKRVGGARNDGAMAARAILSPRRMPMHRPGTGSADREKLCGAPIVRARCGLSVEDTFRNRLSLMGANAFSLRYYTGRYTSLGCNTASTGMRSSRPGCAVHRCRGRPGSRRGCANSGRSLNPA